MGAIIMDVVVWLRSLGVERYEAAFRENDIGETVLLGLTHETLNELGVVSVGHRVKAGCYRRSAERTGALASDRKTAPDCPKHVYRGSCRTPSGHGDVLRFGRLNGTVGAHGPEDLR